MTHAAPIKTLRPNGAFAYTVAPDCVEPAAPHRTGLEVPFYYLAALASITGYANPIFAFRAGHVDAVPRVSLI
jgi:hypothetical protein